MLTRIWNFLFRGKAAAWTALFTGVLTVFTYKLYQVANAANETSREGQRAFVSFSGITPLANLTDPTRATRLGLEVQVKWSNSGTTPAQDALGAASAQLWASELPDGFDFKDLPGVKGQTLAIGPKGEGALSMQLPVNLLASQRAGTSRLYVWGWAVYKDIFSDDPDRLNEFCTEVTHVAIPADKTMEDPNANVGWALAQCNRHNCYDEDCPDYSERVKEARQQ